MDKSRRPIRPVHYRPLSIVQTIVSIDWPQLLDLTDSLLMRAEDIEARMLQTLTAETAGFGLGWVTARLL